MAAIETRKLTTISQKTVTKWGWAPASGCVYYDIKNGKPGQETSTRRTYRVDRVVHLWGLAAGTSPFAEAFAGEEWIYIRHGSKEYRTPLHNGE